MRGVALPLIAVLLVAAVLGIQVAAGGGQYAPLRPANPCTSRPIPPVGSQLDALAGEIVLLGLDNAACRLGISRERLVLALAEHHTLNPKIPAALKAGLRDGVERLDRAGRLPKVSQVLPQVLNQTNLPGLAKTLIEAIPAALVDSLLPTGPLLRRTVAQLDLERLLHQLHDPRRLDSTIRAAILQAALHQILARLRP